MRRRWCSSDQVVLEGGSIRQSNVEHDEVISGSSEGGFDAERRNDENQVGFTDQNRRESELHRLVIVDVGDPKTRGIDAVPAMKTPIGRAR